MPAAPPSLAGRPTSPQAPLTASLTGPRPSTSLTTQGRPRDTEGGRTGGGGSTTQAGGMTRWASTVEERSVEENGRFKKASTP
jgi:hypothetical protein